MKKIIFLLTLVHVIVNSARAQTTGDIIKAKAGEGARQGAEIAVEKTADKVTDKVLNKIFGGKKNSKGKIDTNSNATKDGTNSNAKKEVGDTGKAPEVNSSHGSSLKTYSKFDFIAGEKILGYDDFEKEAVGDFPARWTTNASGELMTVDAHPGKWLSVSKQGFYIPEFVQTLPDNFTLEYDVLYINPAKREGANTPSLALQLIGKTGKNSFELTPDRAYFELDPYSGTISIASYTTMAKILSNEIQVAGLDRINTHGYHVSVWRQKSRLRVYLNETKVVDAPSLLDPAAKYNTIRFATSLNNDGSNWLISNFKFASGLPDTRNKLLTEGKFSTTGILFDVNSANIKATSYGALKDIATVLTEDGSLKVKIVGHTDSDGDDKSNLELSKKRADAVKTALASEFSIDPSRMQTEGKGETQPVSQNNSAESKAQNRRVEFIKL